MPSSRSTVDRLAPGLNVHSGRRALAAVPTDLEHLRPARRISMDIRRADWYAAPEIDELRRRGAARVVAKFEGPQQSRAPRRSSAPRTR